MVISLPVNFLNIILYVFHIDMRGFILAICVRDEVVGGGTQYKSVDVTIESVSRYDENIAIVKNTIYALLSAP